MDMKQKANRLINESSPYLLQHANNPVDWYPWGEQAFAKALAEDKPVLLSSGYSTCHWCHVMAHESFENRDVADVLNKHFVAIKVDREERPDIDNIYMTFCQAMTGGGGWPLTIFMTADQKPFYAGTYFPLISRGNYPGFIDLLTEINRIWHNDRQLLLTRSEEFINAIKRVIPQRKQTSIPLNVINESIPIFVRNYDNDYGGFSSAPKFPMPHSLGYLINYSLLNDKSVLKMVDKTLECMYRGGIYDHVAGGFSRYSTDNKWLVPHFEKMLYDNALLVPLYSLMFNITNKFYFAEVAKETINYLLRDMLSPEGAFYTAEDADSEGSEGLFYVFTKDELFANLPKEEALLFCKHFNITDKGNFEGKSIANLINNKVLLSTNTEHGQLISELKVKVRRYRGNRPRPHRDEKLLAGWNGLLIAALAIAGRIFDRPDYYAKANKCYEFIKKNMCPDGRLFGSYCNGKLGSLAVLDDYAYLIHGLLELFASTGNAQLLKDARHLTENVFMLFGDSDEGGFYFYGTDSEQLVLRPKESYDGALPSGNSIMVQNLLTLSNIKREPYYKDIATKSIKTFANELKNNPLSHSSWLNAIMLFEKQPIHVVISSMSAVDAAELGRVVDGNYYPFLSVVKHRGDLNLESELPYLKDYAVGAKPVAYVCSDTQCYQPIDSPESLKQLLDKLYFGNS